MQIKQPRLNSVARVEAVEDTNVHSHHNLSVWRLSTGADNRLFDQDYCLIELLEAEQHTAEEDPCVH